MPDKKRTDILWHDGSPVIICPSCRKAGMIFMFTQKEKYRRMKDYSTMPLSKAGEAFHWKCPACLFEMAEVDVDSVMETANDA